MPNTSGQWIPAKYHNASWAESTRKPDNSSYWGKNVESKRVLLILGFHDCQEGECVDKSLEVSPEGWRMRLQDFTENQNEYRIPLPCYQKTQMNQMRKKWKVKPLRVWDVPSQPLVEIQSNHYHMPRPYLEIV